MKLNHLINQVHSLKIHYIIFKSDYIISIKHMTFVITSLTLHLLKTYHLPRWADEWWSSKRLCLSKHSSTKLRKCCLHSPSFPDPLVSTIIGITFLQTTLSVAVDVDSYLIFIKRRSLIPKSIRQDMTPPMPPFSFISFRSDHKLIIFSLLYLQRIGLPNQIFPSLSILQLKPSLPLLHSVIAETVWGKPAAVYSVSHKTLLHISCT